MAIKRPYQLLLLSLLPPAIVGLMWLRSTEKVDAIFSARADASGRTDHLFIAISANGLAGVAWGTAQGYDYRVRANGIVVGNPRPGGFEGEFLATIVSCRHRCNSSLFQMMLGWDEGTGLQEGNPFPWHYRAGTIGYRTVLGVSLIPILISVVILRRRTKAYCPGFVIHRPHLSEANEGGHN